MNTWRSGYDLGAVLVSRDPHQGLDSVPDSDVGIRNVVGSYMSLYERLVKEKDRLGKKALRNPRTNQEYGIEDAMDSYKRQDQFDEIATIKRP